MATLELKDKWFYERSDQWPGTAVCYKVKEVLYHKKSRYQDILVFERYMVTWAG
jgi:spermidine synthase